jgi:hypothetical protein
MTAHEQEAPAFTRGRLHMLINGDDDDLNGDVTEAATDA